MNIMIDYKDLMNLGFKKHTAQSIIKEAKVKLVNQGYDIYGNARCGVVPAYIVETIIGIMPRKEMVS